MEWLEAQYGKYRKFAEDQRTVRDAADEIFAEIWKAVIEVVNAGNQHVMGLKINGFPGHHTVSMGSRTLRLFLAEDKQSISAQESDGGLIVVRLMVDSENAVFLENRGEPVSYAESARRIMEPFLFSGESPYAVPAASGKD